MKTGGDRAARLRALRVSFVEEARAECAELARLAEVAAPASDGWRRARKLAHDLRGSGGSYGFPEVSAAAAAVEGELVAPAAAAEPARRSLPDLVRELDAALARAARSLA